MNRLYARAKILGFQRRNHYQNPNVTLLKIEGGTCDCFICEWVETNVGKVNTREDTQFYLGKRVAFVYKAPTKIKGSKIRVTWGKIARPHGNAGVVRARFKKNINPRMIGATARVMLYPSNI